MNILNDFLIFELFLYLIYFNSSHELKSIEKGFSQKYVCVQSVNAIVKRKKAELANRYCLIIVFEVILIVAIFYEFEANLHKFLIRKRLNYPWAVSKRWPIEWEKAIVNQSNWLGVRSQCVIQM